MAHFFTESCIGCALCAKSLPAFSAKMLPMYDRMRGWDALRVPKARKLRQLHTLSGHGGQNG